MDDQGKLFWVIAVCALVILNAAVLMPASVRLAEHALADQHPDWSEDVIHAIAGKTLVLGMTQEMVELAWPGPHTITVTESASGASEEWTYYSPVFRIARFEAGVLSSWTRKRPL